MGPLAGGDLAVIAARATSPDEFEEAWYERFHTQPGFPGVLLIAGSAAADGPTITPDGEVRVRFDQRDNDDFNGDADDSADSLDLRVDIGATVALDGVSVHTTLQTLGTYSGQHVGTAGDVGLFEGYFEAKDMWGSGLSLEVGRQALGAMGTEFLIGDADFWSGISYDAVRLDYGASIWNVALWWANSGAGDVVRRAEHSTKTTVRRVFQTRIM